MGTGKGSRRRPTQISKEEEERRWEKAFGKKENSSFTKFIREKINEEMWLAQKELKDGKNYRPFPEFPNS